jgi:hypothetical protein
MTFSIQEGRIFRVFAPVAPYTIQGRGAGGAGRRHFLYSIENGLKCTSNLKENINGFKT